MARLDSMGTLGAAVAAAFLAFACDSDEAEPNPSFMAGDAGAPTASGGAPSQGHAGEASDGGAPVAPSGGATSVAGLPSETAGAGGLGPEVPPYDCVLYPTTHLEIINACTDATRIEKHPDLPPIE